MTHAGARPAASLPVRLIGAVLRHPAIQPVKRRIADGVWWWRGRAIRNPPLPARVDRVLFLCLGNICRSPFAAVRARQLLAEAGAGHVDARSGGLRASQSPTSPADAVTAAAGYGVDLAGHRARDTTPDDLAAADVIVVMEVAHVDALRRRAPQLMGRVQLLPLYEPDRRGYGGRERVNLIDPFGQDLATFAHCYRRLDAALRVLAAEIVARAPAPPR
jgi:protein-tyrosine-phosphatase